MYVLHIISSSTDLKPVLVCVYIHQTHNQITSFPLPSLKKKLITIQIGKLCPNKKVRQITNHQLKDHQELNLNWPALTCHDLSLEGIKRHFYDLFWNFLIIPAWEGLATPARVRRGTTGSPGARKSISRTMEELSPWTKCRMKAFKPGAKRTMNVVSRGWDHTLCIQRA